MKNVSLVIASLFVTFAAQAQQAPAWTQDANVAYGLFCTADAELTADQMTILTTDQNALSARQNFQAFAADPKKSLSEVVTSFKELEQKATEMINDPKYADQLNQMATQYAAKNQVTQEEALKAIKAIQVKGIVEQQAGGSLKDVITGMSIGNCSAITFVQEQLAKSGCKVADTAAALDTTTVVKFCSDLAPKFEQLNGFQTELQKVQEDLQLYMSALQQAAQIKAQPYLEGSDKVTQEILDSVLAFVGDAAAAAPAVAVPLQAPN